MKKLICIIVFLLFCSIVSANDKGNISVGTYYGFKNACLYKGTTYTFPTFNYDYMKYLVIDVGYLESIKDDVKDFYVLSIGLNLKEVVQKYVLRDTQEDLTIKTKSLFHIDKDKTTWLIVEPGMFVAYNFRENEMEGGIRVDLVNLKF